MAKLKPLRDSPARRRAEHRRRRRDPKHARNAKLRSLGLFVVGVVAGGAAMAALLRSDLSDFHLVTPSGARAVNQAAANTPPVVIIEQAPVQLVSRRPAGDETGEVARIAPRGEPAQAVSPNRMASPDQAISSESIDAAAAYDSHVLAAPPAPPPVSESVVEEARRRNAGQAFVAAPPPAVVAREAPPARALMVYQEPATQPDAGPPAESRASEVMLSDLVQQARLEAGIPESGPSSALPLWQANAVAAPDAGGRPMIAVVLDDLGMNRPNTRRAIRLPAPLTLSFLTYAEQLDGFAADARRAGHELMLHVPMEPTDASLDPGENVLLAGSTRDEIARRLRWGLDRFSGYVGINNHMGSRFTSSSEGMATVLAELRARGLLFLDSRTAVASVGARLAERMAVPYAERDVFIDNDPDDLDAIRRQLDQLERIARRTGAAVGIGHPHGSTLDVLADWLRDVPWRGFTLVPISRIVERKILIAGQASNEG